MYAIESLSKHFMLPLCLFRKAKQAISSSHTYQPTELKYLPFILLINSKSFIQWWFHFLSLKLTLDCYFKTTESAQDVIGTKPLRDIQTSHGLLWHMYSTHCFFFNKFLAQKCKNEVLQSIIIYKKILSS